MYSKKVSNLLVFSIFILIVSGCSNQNIETRKSFWQDGSLKEQYQVLLTEDLKEIYHGKYESWYLSGKLYKEGEYVNGNKIGVWTTWHDSENKMKLMEGRFVLNEMDGEWKYWMDHSHHMNHGDTTHMHHAMDSAFVHPEPHKIQHFRSGKPHGLFISKYPNEQTADSMQYIDGRIVGEYVSYHQNGKVAASGNYIDGKLETELRLWDSLGNKVEILQSN